MTTKTMSDSFSSGLQPLRDSTDVTNPKQTDLPVTANSTNLAVFTVWGYHIMKLNFQFCSMILSRSSNFIFEVCASFLSTPTWMCHRNMMISCKHFTGSGSSWVLLGIAFLWTPPVIQLCTYIPDEKNDGKHLSRALCAIEPMSMNFKSKYFCLAPEYPEDDHWREWGKKKI